MANVLVKDVLLTARDVHPVFDEYMTPDMALMRFLSRYQQRLLTQIAQIKPDAIVNTFEISVGVIDFNEGEELPGHILVHGATIRYRNKNTDPADLTIVGFDQRLKQYSEPTAYIDRSRIYPNGKRTDWRDIRSIEVKYFPVGSEFSESDYESQLDLPGQALDPCVGACAHFMAGRAPKDSNPPINIAEKLAEAEHAEARYIDEITGRRQVTVFHPDVEW